MTYSLEKESCDEEPVIVESNIKIAHKGSVEKLPTDTESAASSSFTCPSEKREKCWGVNQLMITCAGNGLNQTNPTHTKGSERYG